jgi:1-acyl-sn-glycerol-3-phosphate acyltransferase
VAITPLLQAVGETLRIIAPTLVDERRRTLDPGVSDLRLRKWGRAVLAGADVRLVTRGLEHARGNEPFVILSNHQSLYDIPVIYAALDRRIRMVGKKELFRIPLFAATARAVGMIEIDRQNRERAIQSLESAKPLLASGASVWLAPEGTRTKTGALGPFKKGGFRLAIAAGVRILPVTIDGTREVLPATGWTAKRGVEVRVTIAPPVDAPAYGIDGLERLMHDVRAAIAVPLYESLRRNSIAPSDRASQSDLRASG